MTDAGPVFSVERLIRELVVAWKKLVTYPENHPARQGALADAMRELDGLLAPGDPLALGVAKAALVHGDDRLEGLPAQQLAAALYPRGVAVLRFVPGIESAELESFLLLLKGRAGDDEEKLGDRLAAGGIERIAAEEADYSSLMATDRLDDDGAAAVEPADLWERILHWQLDGRPRESAALGALSTGLDGVLRLVHLALGGETEADDGGGEAAEIGSAAGEEGATDGGPGPATPVSAGPGAPAAPSTGAGVQLTPEAAALLEQLTTALQAHLAEADGEREGGAGAGAGGGGSRQAALQQTAQLIGALPAQLRGPMLDAAMEKLMQRSTGDDLSQVAASVSAVEAVRAFRRLKNQNVRFPPFASELLEQIAFRAEGVAIGSGGAEALTRAAGADELTRAAGGEIDSELFDRRQQLFLELPPPPSEEPWTGFDDDLVSLAETSTLQRIIQTCLALLGEGSMVSMHDGLIDRLETAFLSLVAAGRTAAAAALLQELHARSGGDGGDGGDGRQADGGMAAALDRLAGERTAEAIVEALRGSADGHDEIVRLAQLAGRPLIRRLLTQLGETEDRGARRAIFDFLKRLPDEVVAEAPPLLDDRRWFVVRNLVDLLREIGDRRSLPRIHACMAHGDRRVRIAAFKAIAQLDPAPAPRLVAGLMADEDPWVARRAIQIAGDYRLAAAVEPLIELVRPRDLLRRQQELRVQALTSLGRIGDERALAVVRRFLSEVLSTDSADERRAAFLSLGGYPPAVQREWAAKGLRSRDRTVREHCGKLLDELQRSAAGPAAGPAAGGGGV